ncbi:MAG: EVE domain-containing protein [Hyphomicrobiaceae bacterium]|nr:EVE domain-containing protein [Hyphomicrobiaceae bacterium]
MAAGRKKAPAAKTGPSKPVAKRKAPAKPKAAKADNPAQATASGPAYWLFKSEPDVFSWDDLKALGKKGQEWDGVRNYLARNNMRAMKLGDLGFFYHSNAGKDIVGICEVCALAHPDSTTDDDRWDCVDIRAVCEVPNPVTLADVKASPKLAKMSLVTSMRLSVQPVTPEEWTIVCEMGGLDAKKLKR